MQRRARPVSGPSASARTRTLTPSPLSGGQRAVVLGASLAGLLAAHVFSEQFGEVVLLERDKLPERAAPRKGTPHAMHPHELLARGREVLEELFPGFTRALVARGALLGDLQRDLALEAEVRRRVLALRGVRTVTGVDVLAPRLAEGRAMAARYARRDGATGSTPAAHELAAALIVDCTGRGSRTPQWLADWGYRAAAEERVDIGICYTSAYFKRTGACALGPGLDKVAAFGAVTNEQPRPGLVIAQEPAADGVPRWVVGVGGFAGDHAAATLQALRERAADIGSPELVKITHEGEMIGEVIRYTMPHSQRRHYEKLARFPAGLLVLGDALTSFNPIYGQGMTVAACEALALREQLALGQAGLARRFFRAAARVVDIPWQLAVGGDLSIDTVPCKRALPLRLVNAYVARIYRVAPHDAEVSAAFQKVVHMLQGPQTLFAPRLLWRVLVKGRNRRRAAAAAASTAQAGA